ncbi:hypothetical protein L228DRAFT_115871 [Xylona heveae TC161]|uniref:Uncharacterized protein n=1 Tax=Xylona heveae (strain CBS 132557 / TC161) TaxID=1328760 RepID=A0A165HFD1_XYLHT|nr:hypothetical protein L228DRAFT_115871 [Xylona heveae TC161]KZF23426.1 hypothetical protein L228DRAFT_115871 [Xylona heveae TC161]
MSTRLPRLPREPKPFLSFAHTHTCIHMLFCTGTRIESNRRRKIGQLIICVLIFKIFVALNTEGSKIRKGEKCFKRTETKRVLNKQKRKRKSEKGKLFGANYKTWIEKKSPVEENGGREKRKERIEKERSGDSICAEKKISLVQSMRRAKGKGEKKIRGD